MHALAKLPLRLENFARSRVWPNQHLSIHVKIRVYVTCVLSMLLYGCETRPTYRYQEKRLNAFHFRCLRSILGVTWHDRIPNTVLQLWRELVLPIYSLSLEYIDYAGVAMCQNGRWSASEGYLVWATTLCSTTCRSPQTPLQGLSKTRFKGTQHKYGKLGTTGTAACSLALPST